MSRLQETYRKEIVPKLKEKFGYSSVMQVPHIEKITINMGLRWEYEPPISDSRNLLGNFDPNSATGLVQVGHHDEFPLSIYTYGRKAVHENIWDDVTKKCRGIIVENETGTCARCWA